MRKIWLLLSIALLLPMAAQAGAKIKFDNAMHNFDVVSEDGGRVSHSFEFTNEGDAPLVIVEVTTNCGCTTADFPQAPIAVGQQGTIVITFDPQGNPGEFAKEIVVRSNADKKRTKLRIKGVVIP